MNDNPEAREPFDIWQNQTTKGITLRVEEIRKREEQSKRRSLRQRNVSIIAAIINLAAAIAILMLDEHRLIQFWLRVTQVAAFLVILTQLPGLYTILSERFLTLGLTLRSTPCFDFYRKELQLRRDALKRTRGTMVIAGLQGLVLVVFGVKMPILIPVGASMMLAALIWYIRSARESSRVQLEIDDLNAFMRTLNS